MFDVTLHPFAIRAATMSRRLLSCLVVGWMALAACRSRPDGVTPAECGAVAAVLDTLAAMRGDRRMVLDLSTIAQRPGLPPEPALARIAGLTPSTRASYLERRAHAMASCRGLAIRVPVSYASWESVERLVERDGGTLGPAFTARYPGAAAFTSVSRAGLSADGRQALVLVESDCAGRCASNLALVLVERSADGRWRMRHVEILMVSHG